MLIKEIQTTPTKSRVLNGQSDGAYLLKLGASGPTTKFQGKWPQTPTEGQPERKHWLIEKGEKDGKLMAVCSLSTPMRPDYEPEDRPPFPFPSAKELWQEAEHLGGRQLYGEFFKLAELVMVMVSGSVEDERMFSATKYLRSPQRNRLQQQHLTSCAWGFKSEFSVESFPYSAAIGEWLSVKKRHGLNK